MPEPRLPSRRRCHSRSHAVLAAVALGLATLSIVPRPARACHIKEPDVSVYGITLADSDSAVKQIGSGVDLAESEQDMPHARFVSSNGAQELVLFAHYGSGTDEYAEFEVRQSGSEALALKDLPTDSFKTGRGVELGMKPADIFSRFGTCVKSDDKSDGGETIQYEVANADRDPVLKTYGYPLYYAEYEFARGKLVRFRFGFEYP